MHDEFWIDLIGWPTKVAIILGDPLADELRLAIDTLGAKDVQQNANELAQRRQIAAHLTPMGRESYRLASLAIDSAAGQDMLWRDAGLIALGYFRIIEIEVNERFLRPRCEQCLTCSARNFDCCGISGRQKKAWKEALKSLRRMIFDPSARLMLGPLRKMCDDFAHPPPHIDVNLRTFIQAAFESK